MFTPKDDGEDEDDDAGRCKSGIDDCVDFDCSDCFEDEDFDAYLDEEM